MQPLMFDYDLFSVSNYCRQLYGQVKISETTCQIKFKFLRCYCRVGFRTVLTGGHVAVASLPLLPLSQGLLPTKPAIRNTFRPI